MKTLTAILLSAVLIISCSDRKPETIVKKDSIEKTTVKKDTAVTINKEIATSTGKKFIIIETKPTISVSNYMITGAGFENSGDTIKYQLQNPLSTTLPGDLDKNGFEELYLITKSQDPRSGSFMDILGVASYNDKKFGEIVVEPISPEDVQKDERFKGYMGSDSIYIVNNKVVREFPVYKTSDVKGEATEGRRKVFYELKLIDGAYQLVVTGVENIK